MISLIDNGHGIKQENLTRVTEAFLYNETR